MASLVVQWLAQWIHQVSHEAFAYFTSKPSERKQALCASISLMQSGCPSPLKTTHSSRGFLVSGQQQQMGFPVLIPTFCFFCWGKRALSTWEKTKSNIIFRQPLVVRWTISPVPLAPRVRKFRCPWLTDVQKVTWRDRVCIGLTQVGLEMTKREENLECQYARAFRCFDGLHRIFFWWVRLASALLRNWHGQVHDEYRTLY